MTGAVKWRQDGAGVGRNGDVGGDNAVTEAWMVRLVSDEAPGAIIDVNVFGEYADRNEPDYGVTVMIEFCICTDRDHPWDTEQWSDETYDYGADPLAYTTIEDVDRAAKEVAERFAENAGYFAWDGISTQRESLG